VWKPFFRRTLNTEHCTLNTYPKGVILAPTMHQPCTILAPSLHFNISEAILIRSELGGRRSDWRSELGGRRSDWRSELGGRRSDWRSELGGRRSEAGRNLIPPPSNLRPNEGVIHAPTMHQPCTILAPSLHFNISNACFAGRRCARPTGTSNPRRGAGPAADGAIVRHARIVPPAQHGVQNQHSTDKCETNFAISDFFRNFAF